MGLRVDAAANFMKSTLRSPLISTAGARGRQGCRVAPLAKELLIIYSELTNDVNVFTKVFFALP